MRPYRPGIASLPVENRCECVPGIERMKRLADLLLLESARLAEYLGTLTPSDWRQPSACDLWDVGDVVAYLSLAADA